MPRKRRAGKRRIDPTAEADAWAQVFDCEYDLFGELAAFGGVEMGESGRPAREVIEAAWRRLGATFLDRRPYDPHHTPWALATFGEPFAL